MLLTINNLFKNYGAQPVLQNINLILQPTERAGLVGANGVGKSTLLKILMQLETADSGDITWQDNVEVGYLPQAMPEFTGQTIDDVIGEAVGGLRELEQQLRTLEARMAASPGEQLDTILHHYGELSHRFEARGGYELDHRLDQVMTGLGLDYLSRQQPVAHLSGGEKTRLQLAGLLLQSPAALLLDEPTNHLDSVTVEWLESYLATYPGAILMVSHDRQFLNRTVNIIFEIDEHSHQLSRYVGNYETYQEAKTMERQNWLEAYLQQQAEIKELRRALKTTARQVAHNRRADDRDKLSYKARGARVEQSVGQRVRSAEEQLRRLEANPIPKPPKPLAIKTQFDTEPHRSDRVISLRQVSKSFDGRPILQNISCDITPQSRIALMGPNGAGKSTLLKVMLGQILPDSGTVYRAKTLRFGYLAQEEINFNREQTLLEAYRTGLTGHEQDFIAELMSTGLFVYTDLQKTWGQLSWGQRRKVALARLIAEQPDVLLLDEPTNHLSFEVLAAFEAALANFTGPIIAVSHDRWFVSQFGGEPWRLPESQTKV